MPTPICCHLTNTTTTTTVLLTVLLIPLILLFFQSTSHSTATTTTILSKASQLPPWDQYQWRRTPTRSSPAEEFQGALSSWRSARRNRYSPGRFHPQLTRTTPQVRCWSTTGTFRSLLQYPNACNPLAICRILGYIAVPATCLSIIQTHCHQEQ